MTRECPEARGWHRERKVIRGTTYWLRRVYGGRNNTLWQSYCNDWTTCNGPESWESAGLETRWQACAAAHEHAEASVAAPAVGPGPASG
jgi:hypothetical protein